MADVFAKNVSTSAAEAEKIVPRAEFRVFGHDIIEKVKESMWGCGAVLFKARRMPAETYFLSVHTTEANVKVRDGLLDIKTKVGETPEGYEIFQPRGKFQFPVSKTDLAVILSHLKVEMLLDKDQYGIDEFIEMVRKHPDMAAVSVEKMRYGFTVEGIICEYAQVWFNGALLESACCESEDYAGMKKAVEALGIAAMPNTNYLKAARRVVGME
ncbi:hypothetical protein [Desulfovibrio intestinalis]|uniref:CYTH domain-containing protein n=1 Tax=Desulfovibrio intestinalis TaxID=58621 RepID=A0A7W8FG45_9BACT|nr:hypothetical protein [Desulfovibrio intestinalis]MBB5142442.1 hypothetical protein [Desulfovibrio intestinalis]